MTKEFFWFDSGSGSPLTVERWQKYAKAFRPTGVLPGEMNELEVYGDGSSNAVKVRSGEAIICGFYFSSDAEVSVSLGSPPSSKPRIDLVVLRMERTSSPPQIDFAVLNGTEDDDPAAPTPTQTDTTWEEPLAEVRRQTGVSAISSSAVADRRTYSYYPGGGQWM